MSFCSRARRLDSFLCCIWKRPANPVCRRLVPVAQAAARPVLAHSRVVVLVNQASARFQANLVRLAVLALALVSRAVLVVRRPAAHYQQVVHRLVERQLAVRHHRQAVLVPVQFRPVVLVRLVAQAVSAHCHLLVVALVAHKVLNRQLAVRHRRPVVQSRHPVSVRCRVVQVVQVVRHLHPVAQVRW